MLDNFTFIIHPQHKHTLVYDTHTHTQDCTLSEILDEDDVLQECKTHNKKLIDL